MTLKKLKLFSALLKFSVWLNMTFVFINAAFGSWKLAAFSLVAGLLALYAHRLWLPQIQVPEDPGVWVERVGGVVERTDNRDGIPSIDWSLCHMADGSPNGWRQGEIRNLQEQLDDPTYSRHPEPRPSAR